MNRRTFLAGAAALGAGTGASGVGALRGVASERDVATSQDESDGSDASDTSGVERRTETLLAGTEHATPVFVIDAPQPGPTAVVVGGMHGDEPCGYLAAEDIAHWAFGAGTVVVVPRANRVAIERGTRDGEGGDLNRQFPPGEEPTTQLARALWDLVVSHDPDVVLNLHGSDGIYHFHYGFVGQAIFPTVTGDAVPRAKATIEALNDSVVPWYMPFHDYRLGNILTGTAPLLAHKVAADLAEAGYIVETTSFLLDLDVRVRWERRAARELLARHGLKPRPEGGS